jgi:hypothetical protein
MMLLFKRWCRRRPTGIKGVYEWGQKFGMDLGRDKCGVMLWKGMDEGKAPFGRSAGS